MMAVDIDVMPPSNFRKARKHLGYTQGELAELWGVDIKSIGRWERGEVAIPTLVYFCLTLMLKNPRL